MGRATQGVRLITLKGNDEIASVAKIEHDDEEELDETILAEAAEDKAIADKTDADVLSKTPDAEIKSDTDIDTANADDESADDDKTE
jgi:DNA gyrase subunit A